MNDGAKSINGTIPLINLFQHLIDGPFHPKAKLCIFVFHCFIIHPKQRCVRTTPLQRPLRLDLRYPHRRPLRNNKRARSRSVSFLSCLSISSLTDAISTLFLLRKLLVTSLRPLILIRIEVELHMAFRKLTLPVSRPSRTILRLFPARCIS